MADDDGRPIDPPRDLALLADQALVRWYGDGSRWPSSNIDSLNRPAWSPATATDDTWWKQPARMSAAAASASCVPPTLTRVLVSSSALMS